MKAIRKSPTDPKKGKKFVSPANRRSVKDDPTNPGMRNKGLKPLSKDYNWVDAGNGRWADINKDGKTGTLKVGAGAPWNSTPPSTRQMSYEEVRNLKKKNNLR